MSISALISLGSRYLFLGIACAICIVFMILLVNRLIFKGQRHMKKTILLWWTLFICYVVVVLGATLMERSGYWGWGKIMPLFYSYKLAWFNGSAVEWRNIILNICMFIPLGFLLPLGIKCFQSFYYHLKHIYTCLRLGLLQKKGRPEGLPVLILHYFFYYVVHVVHTG